jgi:hypothetical protein
MERKNFLTGKILFAILFIFLPTVLFSQTDKYPEIEKVIEQISDYYDNSLDDVSSEGGVSAGDAENSSARNMEDILEYYERLRKYPLNINSASRSDLKRLVLLTDFQIEALMDYEKNHGPVISYSELSLLNGYNEEIVRLLRPFIYFGDVGIRPGNFFKDCSSSFYSKYARKIICSGGKTNSSETEFGDPNYIQLRYRTVWLNKVEVALLEEKDAGEPAVEKNRIPLGDFISFSIALRNMKFVKRKNPGVSGEPEKLKTFAVDNLVIGDFSARFGQGLTLWNSFNLQGAEDMYGFYKRGEPISPYTSSDEEKFFRGVAAELSCGKLTVSLLGSYKGIDAKIASNGKEYTSILSGGIHNSKSLLSAKDAMHEAVTGANVTALFNKIKIGFSFAGYTYDKINGRSVKDYNEYQMYESFHWNCAADFYTLLGKLRFFGEAAYSSPGLEHSGGYAAVAGGTFPIGGKWKINFLVRSYSKSYINPHAGAYTLTSSCSNQNGAAIRASGYVFRNLKMTMGSDYAYYPWARFNINSSSMCWKNYLKFEFPGDVLNFSLRLSCNYLRTNVIDNICAEKAAAKIRICKWLNFTAKEEVNSKGSYAVSVLSNIKMNVLSMHFCVAYYNAEKWNGRLYMVEYDLPMTYASTLFYGKGISWYAVAQVRAAKWLELFLKCGEKKSLLSLKAGIRFNF